jgi:hypothetical protein
MGKETEKGRRFFREFSEKLDRLIAGKDVETEGQADGDSREVLEFARRMINLRAMPSPAFEANLREKLVQKLEIREVRKRGWVYKLLSQQAVWQAATAALVVIIIGSILWITGVFGFSRPPGVTVPIATPAATFPAATQAPTTTMPAPSTTTASTTSLPSMFLKVDASTDKVAYPPGEPVVIDVSIQNVGQETLQIEKYPPTLRVMDAATGQPVYTFTAGGSSTNLAPHAETSYSVTWLQQNTKGGMVAPGSYYVELEDIDYLGQAIKLTLSRPVEFTIY